MISKIRTSLRLKITIISVITLCTACLISCGIVALYFYLFTKHEVTALHMLYGILAICTLTMLTGGIALVYIIKFVSAPIEEISRMTQKVAKGDFKLELDIHRQDEIGILADNFAKMVKELDGMEYMRKDFMSNVSHELKTPIAAISGFAEILYDGNLEQEEQKEYLTHLINETERLNRLAGNMLRMSRLDNQNLLTNWKKFSLDELIRKTILLLQEKWEAKAIEFDLILQERSYEGDEDLLRQVYINLIENAIKFSENSSVIKIWDETTEDSILVYIEDEGIGIKEEDIPKIFDKFYQCEVSHKNEGNGLGLSIVKRILWLMKGSITCESIVGEGTRFIVKLPKAQVA
ncbi:MAG: signal transduction histidine kinase [Anaerocolumna sp.]|jgi:signal transduction histidine kinase|nr:signal transduction histidine kinase [Anaerocolumna sp.]